MHPLKAKKPTKIRHWRVRQIHVIIGVWLLGTAISLPEYLMVHAAPFCFQKKLYFECRIIWPESIAQSYTIFIFLSTFLVPLSLLSFIYIRLALRMWNHETPGYKSAKQDHSMQEQRTRVFKMLLVVMIVFLVSWLPIQIYSLVNLLFPELFKSFEYRSVHWNIAYAIFFLSHWLSMAHSCINPLIYCFMSKKFRRDLKKRLFWAHWPIGRNKLRASNGPQSSGLCSATLEDRANFQRSLMSRKSCRSPNDFELKRSNRANGSSLAMELPETVNHQVELESRDDKEGGKKGDDELECHSTCDQLAPDDKREAANGHEREQVESVGSNGFASALKQQQQQQQQTSQRCGDETFAMVEFHKQKYTTRLRSNSDKMLSRAARQAAQKPAVSEELKGRSIEANNNINWPTCAPGGDRPGHRLSCCGDMALPIVPTLHEEEEDEEELDEMEREEEEMEGAEELSDGNCTRQTLNNDQGVEARFDPIKQQQQPWCERNFIKHEQSNDPSMGFSRSVIIVSSPSSSSSLSHASNV